MKPNIGYSNMSVFEYLCTYTALAGLLWISTLYTPTKYDISQPIIQECPSLVIRHGVGSDLKSFVDVRDACSESLNIIK